jgi:flagellar basal-body rod modification protein FlgD
MANIDPITALQNTTFVPNTEPASSKLDSVDFMKLLIAQMRNQNPLSESTNPGDIMGQLAQFEMLTKLGEISDGIKVMQGLDELSNAAALIGRTVVGRQVDALPIVLDEISREMYGAPFSAITIGQQRIVGTDPRAQAAGLDRDQAGNETRGVVDKVVVGSNGIPMLLVGGKVVDMFTVSVVE